MYVIILVAFQVFLLTVAVEAFLDRRGGARLGDRGGLGRPRRRRGAVPALAATVTLPATVTAPPARRPRSRRCSPATSRSSWPPASSPSAAAQQDLDWLAEVAVRHRRRRLRRARRAARRRASSASRALLVADLTSHAKGFAFLTTVAATNVVGSASAVIHGWWGLAWVLWYASLAALGGPRLHHAVRRRARSDKPGLGPGINGTWFLLTVSTESIAVLGALLLAADDSDTLAFIASPRSRSASCCT